MQRGFFECAIESTADGTILGQKLCAEMHVDGVQSIIAEIQLPSPWLLELSYISSRTSRGALASPRQEMLAAAALVDTAYYYLVDGAHG